MKVDTFYKAISNGRSYSWIAAESQYCIYYNLGHTIRPRIGKIFVFKNPKKALEFANNNPSTNVTFMSGKGTNPHTIKNIMLTNSSRLLRDFWMLKMRKKKVDFSEMGNCVPNGTFVVDSFTPEKEYTFDEFECYVRDLKYQN